jgi:hypothetical protein
MKIPALLLSLLLLAGAAAGCTAPNAGGGTANASDQYSYGSASCYNPGLGAGYTRDYSYGGGYVTGHNRQC